MNKFNLGKFTEEEVNNLIEDLLDDISDGKPLSIDEIGTHRLPHIPTDSRTFSWVMSQRDKTIGESVEMVLRCMDYINDVNKTLQTVNVTKHKNKLVMEFRNHVCVISDDDNSKETAKRVFSWCKELNNNNISLNEVKDYEI